MQKEFGFLYLIISFEHILGDWTKKFPLTRVKSVGKIKHLWTKNV